MGKEHTVIEKTPGIVLHQIKHTDTGVVVHVFTRNFGRLSLLIKGMRNKKAGRHMSYLQPLTVLDLVFYYRQSRGMHHVKEFSVSYAPSDIHNNVRKSTTAIFLGEVLNAVLREETPQEELFGFIKDSIVYFDSRGEGYLNYHIAFLCGLCSWLGIEPGQKGGDDEVYFDLINGCFRSIPPSHASYADKEISGILARFFSSSWDEMNTIPLTGSSRNEVLETLIRYYSIHLPSLKKIRSLGILKEVFS